MVTIFKETRINLKKVIKIGPIQTNKFKVYSGITYSFTVHFKNESIHGVDVREPAHFCSHDERILTRDRMELEEKHNTWRIH